MHHSLPVLTKVHVRSSTEGWAVLVTYYRQMASSNFESKHQNATNTQEYSTPYISYHNSLNTRRPQSKVVVDPYAPVILSRRSYGQLGPDLAFGSATPGSTLLSSSGPETSGSGTVLGLARTWPQAAGVLPCAEGEGVRTVSTGKATSR